MRKDRLLSYGLLLFVLSSAFYMVLTPQYFGAIFSIIFIIPIYIGIRGIRRKSKKGLTFAFMTFPLFLLVSTIWLKSAYLAFFKDKTFIPELAKTYELSIQKATTLFTFFSLLAVLLLVFSLGYAIIFLLNKDEFH